ncbi:hypothetical protein, partial [Phocaeicola sp.]|uniref:hypothetical protein n=1 Tax=Phocaeicola sp. TaxID=2773926 RepID=UPI003AB3491D
SVLIRDNKILEVTNCDLALIGAKLIDAKGMYIPNRKRLSMYIPSKGKKSSVNIFTGNLQSIWAPVSMEACG